MRGFIVWCVKWVTLNLPATAREKRVRSAKQGTREAEKEWRRCWAQAHCPSSPVSRTKNKALSNEWTLLLVLTDREDAARLFPKKLLNSLQTQPSIA